MFMSNVIARITLNLNIHFMSEERREKLIPDVANAQLRPTDVSFSSLSFLPLHQLMLGPLELELGWPLSHHCE